MRIRLALLGLLLCAPLAAADEVVFYRCTDASGALTMQNMPCPKGDRQEKKVMQAVSTMPMATPASTPRPVAAQPAPGIAQAAPVAGTTTPMPSQPVVPEADRLPPPVLFQCTTHDKDSYISEDPEPAPRCVVLRTTGLDGNPQNGAGEACEVVRDQCARVPDGALCDAWKKRLGETAVALRFGRPENQEKNRAEHERVQDIVSHSTCTN